jgi:hypothetical protein
VLPEHLKVKYLEGTIQVLACKLEHSRKSQPASLDGVFSLIHVQVTQLLGRIFADCHLLVVEDRPAAVLLQVTHVMPAPCVGPHVTNESGQPVASLAVLKLACLARLHAWRMTNAVLVLSGLGVIKKARLQLP